jgi:ribonucleotide reductase alpha subunit
MTTPDINNKTIEDNSVEEVVYVIKRDGRREEVSFDKVSKRIKNISHGLNVSCFMIAQKVCNRIYPDVSTTELDELSAKLCASMSSDKLDYGTLAARIIISNNHKNTLKSFTQSMIKLYNNVDNLGNHVPLISESVYNMAIKYEDKFDEIIDHSKDYNFDYFGYKTLERAYLIKIGSKVVERIQHMFMRVSIGIWGENIKMVIRSYELLSGKYFTHATPTLYHAGTPRQQMISCFLIGTDDSIRGIYKTISDCAMISKWAGGIGVHIHNIRGKGAYIRGTNGSSNGIIPMLKVYNDTAEYVDQCVTPDTIIYTTQGAKKIQDVVVGETEIFNTEGGCEVVKNVLEHSYEGDIYCIKTMHSFSDLKITGEHPVFGIQEGRKPDWIDVKDINKNTMIGYRIPEYVKDVEGITEDDCYFYGLMIKSGYMKDDKNYFVYDVVKEKEFIKRYLENKYVEYEDNDNKIIWNKSVNLPVKYSDLYTSTDNKHIQYRWLNLPIEKSAKIIEGLFNKFVFTTQSSFLIKSIRYLLLKMGVLSSCEKISNNYSLTISDGSNYLRYDKFLFTPVTNIKSIPYKGTLYDLQMSKVHNYMLDNGIIHNGGGRRKGSFSIYLEPHHPDILEFLEIKLNQGDESQRARDLFPALWISDYFMYCVENKLDWYLMDPDTCPDLIELYGEDFTRRYLEYVEAGTYVRKLKAQQIWKAMVKSQTETGTPYVLFKCNINRKSNQKNIGTIKSSNLCGEIVEYSDDKEYACCCLISLCLPTYVDQEKRKINYNKIIEVCEQTTRNLNQVVDLNYYPVPETKRSNMRHRPLGHGVQGLADLYILMRVAFESEEARVLNKKVFETIYYGTMRASMLIAKERYQGMKKLNQLYKEKSLRFVGDEYTIEFDGDSEEIQSLITELRPNKWELEMNSHFGAYSSFVGSPLYEGKFQFDLWDVTPSDSYNWTELMEEIQKYGVRNSLLVALMPTASTSQIMGNNEAFEPYTSNAYVRSTNAGAFKVLNKHLIKDLMGLGKWNKRVKESIIEHEGSIQHLDGIGDDIKSLYKTVWEIKQSAIINQAAERGPFICQTQSMNLHFEEPTMKLISSALFAGWKKGLKTGSYYIRGQPRAAAQKFTIEAVSNKKIAVPDEAACESCSA